MAFVCLTKTRALRGSEAAPDSNDPKAKAKRLLDDMEQTKGTSTKGAGPDVRRLFAARELKSPLYVQEQGARVGKRGERLTITKSKEQIGDARMLDVSQVVLMGNVQISAQALHLLMEKGIPTIHLSTGRLVSWH